MPSNGIAEVGNPIYNPHSHEEEDDGSGREMENMFHPEEDPVSWLVKILFKNSNCLKFLIFPCTYKFSFFIVLVQILPVVLVARILNTLGYLEKIKFKFFIGWIYKAQRNIKENTPSK